MIRYDYSKQILVLGHGNGSIDLCVVCTKIARWQRRLPATCHAQMLRASATNHQGSLARDEVDFDAADIKDGSKEAVMRLCFQRTTMLRSAGVRSSQIDSEAAPTDIRPRNPWAGLMGEFRFLMPWKRCHPQPHCLWWPLHTRQERKHMKWFWSTLAAFSTLRRSEPQGGCSSCAVLFIFSNCSFYYLHVSMVIWDSKVACLLSAQSPTRWNPLEFGCFESGCARRCLMVWPPRVSRNSAAVELENRDISGSSDRQRKRPKSPLPRSSCLREAPNAPVTRILFLSHVVCNKPSNKSSPNNCLAVMMYNILHHSSTVGFYIYIIVIMLSCYPIAGPNCRLVCPQKTEARHRRWCQGPEREGKRRQR